MPSSSKGSSFWKVESRGARAVSPTSLNASDPNISVLGPPILSKPLPRVASQTSRSIQQVGTPRSCPVASRSGLEVFALPLQPEDAPDPSGPEAEPQVSPRLAENLVTRGARMEGVTSTAKDIAAPVLGVLKSIEPVAEALQRLSRIHPIAELAMLTIFAVFKLVKAQYESDSAIVALHNAVVNTYEIAIKNEALSKDSRFDALFRTMVRQADECYLFISEYRSRRYLGEIHSPLHVSRKIQEFMEAFTQLERQFRGAEIDFTAVSLLKMRPVIETLDVKNKLERLKPPQDALGPLSHCLPGTRTQSFQSIRDWIFQGEESVLWVNGPAGSGKSSLMGTLHNRLLEMGFNSRLATFIRFDRDVYKDARVFVRTLAYRLALFDSRLGETIAERVAAQPQIVDDTDLSTQLRSLVLHPLQQHVKDMQTEGPIIILIDGLDECSRSDGTGTSFREQLLTLFQSNYLGAFPFLRVIIASRPVQDIKAKFTGKSHILSFPLDITSPENQADVRSFIDTKLQEISDHTSGFGELCHIHNAVEELSKRAAGLFMWASVAVSFLASYSRSRLKAIVDTDIPKTALEALDTLYKTTLEAVASERGDEDIKRDIRLVLGIIMAASTAAEWNPHFTPSILQSLLVHIKGEDGHQLEVDVVEVLDKLGSVLKHTDDDAGLQLLHVSFAEFLRDEERSASWYIDDRMHAGILAAACVSSVLSHIGENELAEEHRQEFIYTSSFWLDHCAPLSAQVVESTPGLYDGLLKMIRVYLVRWMYCHLAWKRRTWARWKHLDVFEALMADPQVMYSSTSKRFRNLTDTQLSRLSDDLSLKQLLSDAQVFMSVGFQASLRDQHWLAACFTWLCQHSSSDLYRCYVPAFVQMANGSNQHGRIVAAIKKNQSRYPPIVELGVSDVIEISGVPQDPVVRSEGDRE
ncbi:hypothetical protein AAF712_003002 [Marasmius tenuissimus]|uniref:NACHT domain-containing protein n=1 Tax=Marasmius tenuissimus TaxID=585030 RepID=A0ABR3A7U0_9AGAR